MPFVPRALRVEELEDRVTPVLANNALAPLAAAGTGFDGVVLITATIGGRTFTGTGFLLPTGRHVLTAAHNFTNPQNQVGLDVPARVSFDMPNGAGGSQRLNIDVPAAAVRLHPGYAGQPENDLAVMTLPILAPSGPVGTLGADRYPIYRGTDEAGQTITIAGYGTIGTGTTGQQENADLTKRVTRNRYDTVGSRVNFAGEQALLYDFDNGTAGNDAFGRILGLADTGLPDEGTAGQGDSGGPVFITVNGQRVVAGTTTSGPGADNPQNPAIVNAAVMAGFGSISHDTRMSFHAAWIDQNSAQPAAEALDLRAQVVGQDAVADTILVRVAGANLEVVVNGQVYQSIPVAGVTSLTLTGAGADGTPFATSATIDSSVPAALAINQQRILTFTDNRVAPTAPTNTPAAPATGAAPAGTPQRRLEQALNLQTFPNLAAVGTLLATGAAAGGAPRVVVTNTATGQVVRDFLAYEAGFTGGVRTAVGDVTGDLVDDVITSAGPGGAARIRVFDGVTGAAVRDFFAFERTFVGGAYVAVADVTGDGVGDVVVGAGEGGGPRVLVIDGTTGATVRDFFAFEQSQRNGVSVAAGDVNDDGAADVVVGAGPGGAPRVSVFDGRTLGVLSNFFAFDPSFRNGVWVAAGDADGGGSAEVFAGAGPGGGPHVKSFDGLTGQSRLSFFAFPTNFTGGARVAVADSDGDGLADIVVGSGPGDPLFLRSFLGDTGAARADLTGFDPAFRGGVFVGGQG